MHPSFKRLGGEASWVAAGIILSTLGTLIGVRLLTSVMAPSEYGRFALAISISLGLVYSLGYGGAEAVTRFFSIAKNDGKALWYWKSLKTSFFGIIVIAVVFATIAGFISFFNGSSVLLWTITFIFGGALSVQTVAIALHTGARNRRTVGAHQCVYEWGRFLLAFVLLLVFCRKAWIAIFAFFIITTGVIFSERYWAGRLIFSEWSSEEERVNRKTDFFSYLWPMVLAGLFFWLQMFVDRWSLNMFCSLREVGIYFAIYQISYSPMIYFSRFLSGFIGPILYGRSGDGTDDKRTHNVLLINEKISLILLVIVVIFFLIALLVGQFFCSILIDDNYSAGFWVFPWLLLSGGIYAIAQQLLLSVTSGMNTKIMVPVRFCSAFLATIFYMGGAFVWGFKGAVFGGVLFSFVFFMITLGVHLLHKRKVAAS